MWPRKRRMAFNLNNKALSLKKRKPGRPASGTDPLAALRLPMKTRQTVLAWATNQPGQPKLPEAIRRLIDIGLDRAPGKTPEKAPSTGACERVRGHKATPQSAAATVTAPKAHHSVKPADDMKPYDMPEDTKAFNEYWIRAEQSLKRPLEYEEVIVLYNRYVRHLKS
jgi:hypothetical protein